MTTSRRYTYLDVFTDTPLQGNGLAVIHDADGMSDAAMQAVARETLLSETSFVQSPDADGADYRHRIFMTTGEIPFAGHPSLGTAVAVARARGLERATLVQQTQPGLQPIDVEIAGSRARASMLQEPPWFGPELAPADALGPVGLAPGDALPGVPPQIVATGVPQLVALVADAGALARCRPDYAAIGDLLGRHDAIVLYVAWVDAASGAARARSFLRTREQGEDPATGSAAGPLCAYVHVRLGAERLRIDQGAEMGRPSRLDATVEGDRVRVGGDVVVLLDGELHLDA